MQILEPDYISKFKCDGTKCSTNCCKRNWTIDIDDATFSKYKHIKPTAKAKEITKHIKTKIHPFKGKINQLMLNEKKQCPFLDTDNLCSIQKTYGEDYLSVTCKTYPRINFKISDDFMYRALSLTCPLVCNLVLNVPRDSGFYSYKLPKSEAFPITYNVSRYSRGFMLPLLNVTNYNILRCQDLTLDERLAIVALFCESANDTGTLEKLADISEIFEKEMLKNAKEILAPMKFNPVKFLKEILSFINALFTEIGKNQTSQIYVKFINEVFEISILEDDVTALDFDKLLKIYEEKYLPAKEELFKINELQIENYAINYLFMTALPLGGKVKNFGGNIVKYLLEYKMSEFMFVCFYASIKDNWHKVAIELAAEDISNCFEHQLYIRNELDKRMKNIESVIPIIQLLLDV